MARVVSFHSYPFAVTSIYLLWIGVCAVSARPIGAEVGRMGSYILHNAKGQILGSIPIESTDLDRVEYDVDPGSETAVASVRHGRYGGSSLYLVTKGKPPRLIRETLPGEVIRTAMWSDKGDRFAYAVRIQPTRVVLHQVSVLQLRGEVWWGTINQKHQRVPTLEYAASVLGWIDERTLLVTQFLPGDLPQVRPYSLDVVSGALEAVSLPDPKSHYYSFTLVGKRLFFVRTGIAVQSIPRPNQALEIWSASLPDGPMRKISTEMGKMPVEFQGADGEERVQYRLEGTREIREVCLRTTSIDSRFLPEPSPAPQAKAPALVINMPYIHQHYDTPDAFNGWGACGSTSMLMGILHYGKLDPHPIQVTKNNNTHTSDFGFYDSEIYSAYGTTFNQSQPDPAQNPAYGAFGWCSGVTNGVTVAWDNRMQDYAKKHGLNSEIGSSVDFNTIKNHLDQGKTMALFTYLSSVGHIIAIKGYTTDNKLIANDPLGDANKTYPNTQGEGVVYSFSEAQGWHYVSVSADQPSYRAQCTAKDAPATMTPGSTASVSITYKNTGSAVWDASTKLATTEPRDRASAFYTAGSWIRDNQPAKVGEWTAPEKSFSFTFSITAPAVTQGTAYTEHFNLFQDGVGWFSDGALGGGPADADVFLTIQVVPQQEEEAYPLEDGGSTGEEDGSAVWDEPALDRDDKAPAQDESEIVWTGGCGCRTSAPSVAMENVWWWMGFTFFLLGLSRGGFADGKAGSLGPLSKVGDTAGGAARNAGRGAEERSVRERLQGSP